MCRRWRMQRETSGHILWMCLHTKSKRIRRHDEIKHFIAGRLPERFSTFFEPAVNVAAIWRSWIWLSKTRIGWWSSASQSGTKTGSAWPMPIGRRPGSTRRRLNTLNRSCATAKVFPIVIGCRGVMPRSTVENVSKLGIRGKDLIVISMSALRSSVEIANALSTMT